jgi:hypothetical protein
MVLWHRRLLFFLAGGDNLMSYCAYTMACGRCFSSHSALLPNTTITVDLFSSPQEHLSHYTRSLEELSELFLYAFFARHFILGNVHLLEVNFSHFNK